MESHVHAVLIDPFTKTVKAHAIPLDKCEDGASSYEGLVAAVSGGGQRLYLEHVTLANFVPKHLGRLGAYVDEEGLLKPWQNQGFIAFGWRDRHIQLAGRVVVVTDTPDGDVTHCAASVRDIERLVTWLDPREVVVAAPTFSAADENMNPVGEPTYLAGTPTWSFESSPAPEPDSGSGPGE